MLSIHLHHLLFYAKHGLYEEEKMLGNRFEVNITVNYHPPTIPITQLSNTIDYVSVYALVKQKMAVPTELLETLATGLAKDILTEFLLAEEVLVSIKKIQVPVLGMQGQVGVSFALKRAELVL